MTILSEDALEFAKLHITKYYDSDFFPKPIEFEALWHNWADVKKELTSKNVSKLWVTPPRVFPAPKPTGDFRVVHQLEPLNALTYTALAYEIADAIEAARIPEKEKVACSYRINLDQDSFFSNGSGYGEFTEQIELMANDFEYVLVTDITDFYNQIYLHRLNNAVESANNSLKSIGDDIESFISNLNGKSSQGIPVGPAASIVMAEAILIDVDNFIRYHGVPHTRYVDDIRIFSKSIESLKQIQQQLTLYLYETHRLTLSSTKTEIKESKLFVEQRLHNPFAEERDQIFKSLEVFNPYTGTLEVIHYEDEDEKLIEQLIGIVERILNFERVDLGLARSAIRRAKQYQVLEIADLIIENLEFFSPVINDVVLFLIEITDEEFVDTYRANFSKIVNSSVLESYIVRFWIEWYLTDHIGYISDPTIQKYIYSTSYFSNRAKAAITLRDIAWVRAQKSAIYNLGSWERWALLNAARVLPSDERNHWLKLTEGSSPVLLDRWMAKWVRETA